MLRSLGHLELEVPFQVVQQETPPEMDPDCLGVLISHFARAECPRPLRCRHLGYPSSVFAWSQQGRLHLARWKCCTEAQPPASGLWIRAEGKVRGNAWLPGKAARGRRGGRLLAEAEATVSGVICSPLSLGLTRRSYS